jgi:flagellar basal-body rod protein FlgF
VNSGIYTGYSGMKAQVEALDVLANNLANLNTTGFKEEKVFYTLLNQALGAAQEGGDLNAAINSTVTVEGGMNPTGGSMTATNRDLDVAIEGDGFLVVQTPRGIRYTRNGNLSTNAKGELTTSDGSLVLGSKKRPFPITLGPGKVQISEGGEVKVNGVEADRLKVVTFKDLSRLDKEGNSLFLAREGRESEIASKARIKAGYLEESNVNPVSSVVRMISIMRNFESIQKSINLIMNDINAKSIEKLGR